MRWIYAVLWLVLVLDLVWWSPPPAQGQERWILEALQGQWDGKNPATVALFNVMGIWPLVFASRFVNELRARPLPAWPFIAGGMVVGAFAILPYLFFQPSPPAGRDPGVGLRWLGSRVIRGLVATSGLGLLGWGVVSGDWAGYWESFQSEQLIQVMSLDFLALGIAFGLSWRRGVSSP